MDLEEIKYKTTFLTLIREYRRGVVKKYGRFPSFEEYSIGNLSPPTQIVFFHSVFPEIEVILLFHLQERKDLEFHFYRSRDHNDMFKIIENSLLNNPIIVTLGREVVEKSLADILKNSMFYNIITVPFKNSFLNGSSNPSYGEFSVQLFFGSILKVNQIELVRKLVSETTIRGPDLEISNAISQNVPILKGLGTHSDPPIWIDIPGKKPFRELVYEYPNSSKIEYNVNDLGGCKALICKDGYIAIGTEDRERAMIAINALLGSAMVLLDKSFNVVRDNDIGSAEFTDHSAGLSGGKFWTHSSMDSVPPILIHNDKVKEIFKLAATVMNNPKLQTELILALEARAHEKNGELKQAILIGWLFLEDVYVADLWSKLMQSIPTNSDRKDRLNGYDVATKLEILNISGKIQDNEFRSIGILRKSRNETIHKGNNPQKRDVKSCLELVFDVLRKDLGISHP